MLSCYICKNVIVVATLVIFQWKIFVSTQKNWCKFMTSSTTPLAITHTSFGGGFYKMLFQMLFYLSSESKMSFVFFLQVVFQCTTSTCSNKCTWSGHTGRHGSYYKHTNDRPSIRQYHVGPFKVTERPSSACRHSQPCIKEAKAAGGSLSITWSCWAGYSRSVGKFKFNYASPTIKRWVRQYRLHGCLPASHTKPITETGFCQRYHPSLRNCPAVWQSIFVPSSHRKQWWESVPTT